MNTITAIHAPWVRCLLAALIAVSLAFSAAPADACGCGIYIPLEGQASVSEEHVLIRWDGQTEDIVMTLGVLGSSKEAAVIFPVPAQATVKLGDARLFDELRELTKPRIETVYALFPMEFAGGVGARPGAVTLIERQTLGPFDVSTLAASDVDALGEWLAANGYNLPPEVTAALEPYVEQGWYYIAVRLSPGAGGEALQGKLDPLQISFPYDQIVYPMRPSALAKVPLTVFMYILADHRVMKNQTFGLEHIQYADWIDPADLQPGSALAGFVTEKLFLTKISEQINQPETIDDDYTFVFTPDDNVYHTVIYRYVYDIAGIPIILLILCSCGLLVLALVSAGLLLLRRRAKRGQPAAAPG